MRLLLYRYLTRCSPVHIFADPTPRFDGDANNSGRTRIIAALAKEAIAKREVKLRAEAEAEDAAMRAREAAREAEMLSKTASMGGADTMTARPPPHGAPPPAADWDDTFVVQDTMVVDNSSNTFDGSTYVVSEDRGGDDAGGAAGAFAVEGSTDADESPASSPSSGAAATLPAAGGGEPPVVVKSNRNPIPSVQEGPELWKALHHSQGNLEAISAQIENLLAGAHRQKLEMNRYVDMMHAQQTMMQQFKSTVSASWSTAGTAGAAGATTAEGVYQDGRVLSDAEVCTEATFAGAAQLFSKLGAKVS